MLNAKGHRSLILFLLLLGGFLALMKPGTTAKAGWVDDWIAQKTTTSPGYFEGQKRSYATGGSFSARWQNGTDYPVSITAPKIKVGCGGIDLFMGGFSFLNMNYLQTKLQNILANAPAAAFDLGLHVLCEQCSNTIKSLEAIIDDLNNLQINDCKASKAVVATLVDPLTSNEAIKQKLGEAQTDFKVSSGGSALYKDVTDLFKSSNGASQVNVTDMIADCPLPVRQVFGTSGSLVTNLAALRGLPMPYADLVRGYIGDVTITIIQPPGGAPNSIKMAPIPPCPQNDQTGIKDFLTGTSYYRDSKTGNCLQVTDTNKNLVLYVQTQMTDIAVAMKAATALNATQVAFVNQSPIPVAAILKHAIGTGREGELIATMSDITAKAYASAMISDLFSNMNSLMYTAQQLLSEGHAQTADPSKCSLHAVGDVGGNIKAVQGRTRDLQKATSEAYSTSLKEVNTIMAFAETINHYNDLSAKMLTDKFGSQITGRALGL